MGEPRGTEKVNMVVAKLKDACSSSLLLTLHLHPTLPLLSTSDWEKRNAAATRQCEDNIRKMIMATWKCFWHLNFINGRVFILWLKLTTAPPCCPSAGFMVDHQWHHCLWLVISPSELSHSSSVFMNKQAVHFLFTALKVGFVNCCGRGLILQLLHWSVMIEVLMQAVTVWVISGSH